MVVDRNAEPLTAPAHEAGLAVCFHPHHLRQGVSTGVGRDVPHRDFTVWRKTREEGKGRWGLEAYKTLKNCFNMRLIYVHSLTYKVRRYASTASHN